MLILNPRSVRFGEIEWDGVRSVAIDRIATREIVEHSDLGPHAVYADAPERRVTIRIVRELLEGELGGPAPGDADTLTLRTSPNASDAGGATVTAMAVVMRVTHELKGQTSALQTITLIATSASGDTDPIAIN